MICALHARTPAPGLCRPLQTPLRRYLYCRCVMLGPTRSRCRRVLDIAALTRLHRHVCHRVPLSHRVACTPTQLHMILIPRSTEPTTAATGHRGTRVALVVGAAVRSHRCPALLRARAAPTSIGCHRMPCMRCLHQLPMRRILPLGPLSPCCLASLSLRLAICSNHSWKASPGLPCTSKMAGKKLKCADSAASLYLSFLTFSLLAAASPGVLAAPVRYEGAHGCVTDTSITMEVEAVYTCIITASISVYSPNLP